MQFQYPHTIKNGAGETLTFKRLVNDPAGDWLEVENVVAPNCGPPMHVHHKQAESLTVVQGKMGIEIPGQAPSYVGPGETAVFEAGIPHRFWNAGSEPLICTGWIKPAQNIEYFLTGIFDSMKENSGKQPGAFDAAYLLGRYRSEYDMLDIPGFVKKKIFPIVLFFGKLQGKQRKFKGAPKPM